MSADIFQERFLARENPAWWDYEGNFTFPEDRDFTCTEAVSEARLDYEMKKVPNYVRVDGEEVETGYYSVVREPLAGEDEPKVFQGNVSDQYGLLQNMDIARILDDVSKKWPVETVGALGDGERMFIVLDADKTDVGPSGDTVTGYYLVTDNKVGGGRLTAAFTPTRVVCMNTLKVGLSSANVRIDLEHTSDVEEQLKLVNDLMQDLRDGQSSTWDAFDEMARFKVATEDLNRMLEEVYPVPEPAQSVRTMMELESDMSDLSEGQKELVRQNLESFERRRDAQKELQEEARRRYNAFNSRNPQVAGTAWAAYNAIAESESWRESTNESIRARSVLLGERGKTIETAFDQTMEMVG